MSDSEGNKELSGIARSIDALFAEAPPDADESSGVETPPHPPNVPGDALTGSPVLPDQPEPGGEPVPGSGGAALPPLPETEAAPTIDAPAPPPLPETEAAPTIDAPAPPPLPETEASPAAGVSVPPPLPDTEPAPPVDASVPPPLPDTEPAPPVDAPVPPPDSAPPAPDAFDAEPPVLSDEAAVEAPPDDADAAAEATRLDLAVDAYLDGDTGKASEIRTIAEEMLESRELDPIARSVARLATAAGDPADPSVLAVAEAISSPFVLARLAGLMGGEHDVGRREEYYLACRNLGEPMAVAVRDDLAESTDRHARRIHCEALVEMGDEGRRMIEQMALDENRFLVRNAVAILGETGGDRAVELVTIALANPDARVRREALRSLAKLGDEESGELVFGLLDDSDRDVRIAAAVTAGGLQVERALRPMIKLLDDSNDPDESIPLIRALGHLGDPGAVPSIEKHAVRTLFSKPRTDVRIVAYRALQQIGTPHARRLLNQAVDDKEAEVKAAVKEMLGMS